MSESTKTMCAAILFLYYWNKMQATIWDSLRNTGLNPCMSHGSHMTAITVAVTTESIASILA